MERSISTLSFKGSIPEAILEAKMQKKLLVVYISGEDAESTEQEESTWTDSKVADSLAKHCILLHIISGTVDATNFSAIYPYKSVPCITAVGYNGVQLWQSEGFVSAEVLASSLEKAWLKLHIQETTATVLTAALSSQQVQPSTSGSSSIGPSGLGSSSGTDTSADSVDKDIKSSENRPAEPPQITGNDYCVAETGAGKAVEIEDVNTKLDHTTSRESFKADTSHVFNDELSTTVTESSKGLPSTLEVDPDSSVADHLPSGVEGRLALKNSVASDSGVLEQASERTLIERDESVEGGKVECITNEKADALNNNTRVTAPTDVHLNIRLPGGTSLQEKFSVTSTLSTVKDYVDRNQASSVGSYDLAIPYPRKVFDGQDMGKSLSDLGLFNRQALIVVPRQRGTAYHRGGASSGQAASTNQTDSSDANDGGYFSFVRSILSYINPLSYLGGRASSSNLGQAQTGTWEYSPNPVLQGNSAAAAGDDGRSRGRTTSGFGSNIHTLKHDEDDERFKDRNSFWNGNSTQYGGAGDNDGK